MADEFIDFSKLNAARIANNYFHKIRGGEATIDEANFLNQYITYILDPKSRDLPKYKVGVMLICINNPYWQYAYPVIEGLKQFFLPGHETEIMLWSDMPSYPEAKDVTYGAKIFPVESVTWPYPTLMRYHYFLKQEEYLRKFDYLFYIDLDMRIVGLVGDEILGESLTMAQHPMYALRDNLYAPYEPNSKSTAHIKMPGRVIEKDGKPFFQPLYAAGGFQGGKTKGFIKAMKSMKKGIDTDLDEGYVARWNDESHWNKYLFDHPPSTVLSPAYVYPDSMIESYYLKVWGRNYVPKIITLTKPFSTSAEGGAAAAQMTQTL